MSVPTWLSRLTQRTHWVLWLSLVMGLAAAFMAWRLIQHRLNDLQQRQQVETVELLVAKSDLVQGQRLDNRVLATRPIPAAHAHAQALRPGQYPSIEGQTLAYPLKSGEPLLWSMLETHRPQGLTEQLATGRRAVTLSVKDIHQLAGLLRPGDHIDLYLSLKEGPKPRLLALMQGVKVLATGAQALASAPTLGTPGNGFAAITLDTDEAGARRLLLARDMGELTVSLRPSQEPVPDPVATADPFPPGRPEPAPTRQSRWTIPVLYGGTAASSPPASVFSHGQPPIPTSAPWTLSANPALGTRITAPVTTSEASQP